MPGIPPLTFDSFGDTLLSLALAFLLGGLIGAERQYRERTAGLRTHILVALGACQFVDMGLQVGGAEAALRVVANVVTGIGFLGAGLIIKDGANVRGLNTAATVWCSAAVGACAGANMPAQAALLTLFVLACNTVLRPLAQAIDRAPLRDEAAEAEYEVTLAVETACIAAARGALAAALAEASYPAAGIEEETEPSGATRLTARLATSSVVASDLDAVVARLHREPGLRDAAWRRRTAR